ncbi:MAG: acylneuraminate cytidylyltransferase family protein [Desulfobacterales bacterium]|jgi:CMP-N-acetylneuraminic acid synthetase
MIVNDNQLPGRVLAVIPARGGSKGVARKNIRSIGGKPLIAYTIEMANAIQHMLYRAVVSTDDPEIESVARRYGGDVPFLRPAELSGDRVPTLPVLQHAVKFVEEQGQTTIDWVLLLQPTTPFRSIEDIDATLALAQQGGCDSIISVVQVFAEHPIFIKRIENDRLLPFNLVEKEGTRRQDCHPPAYIRNGAVYLTRRDIIMNANSIWGEVIRPYVMPPERSVNIDGELDLKLAEALIREHQEQPPEA